jgi:hypothetical protein
LPRSKANFKGGLLRASITASFCPTFDSHILDKPCHVQAHTWKAKSTLIWKRIKTSKSLLQRRKRHLLMDIVLQKAPSNSSRVPRIKHRYHAMPLATRKITSDKNHLTNNFCFQSRQHQRCVNVLGHSLFGLQSTGQWDMCVNERSVSLPLSFLHWESKR